MLPSLQLAECEAADGLLCLFRHPSSSSSCWNLRWRFWGRYHPTSHHITGHRPQQTAAPALLIEVVRATKSRGATPVKKTKTQKPSAMDQAIQMQALMLFKLSEMLLLLSTTPGWNMDHLVCNFTSCSPFKQCSQPVCPSGGHFHPNSFAICEKPPQHTHDVATKWFQKKILRVFRHLRDASQLNMQSLYEPINLLKSNKIKKTGSKLVLLWGNAVKLSIFPVHLSFQTDWRQTTHLTTNQPAGGSRPDQLGGHTFNSLSLLVFPTQTSITHRLNVNTGLLQRQTTYI